LGQDGKEQTHAYDAQQDANGWQCSRTSAVKQTANASDKAQ